MPQSYNNDFEIFNTYENIFRYSFSDLISLWWQWLVSIPKDCNPALDANGIYANIDQNFELFFLAGKDGNAERQCVIPFHKPIFFPITASQATPLKYINATENELIRIVKKKQDNVINMSLFVDDVEIQELNQFRYMSNIFQISAPNNNILNLPAGVTTAVSDGRWILLRFLHHSKHKIKFMAREVDPEILTNVILTNVTYHLTIL